MFFSKRKISIDRDLYQKLVETAQQKGYSSTDEFVIHVLERETAGAEEQLDEEQAARQLRGLGYIE